MQKTTNQTRHFLALLLVFALCVGMLPAFVIPASAASYNIVKTDFSSLVLSGDYAFFPKYSTEGGTAAVGSATEISLYSDYKSDLEKYYAVTAANANGTSGMQAGTPNPALRTIPTNPMWTATERRRSFSSRAIQSPVRRMTTTKRIWMETESMKESLSEPS